MLREKFVLLRFLHANFFPRNPISFLQFPSFCLSPMYVRLRIKLDESRLIVSMDKSDDSRAKIDGRKIENRVNAVIKSIRISFYNKFICKYKI